MRMMRMMRRMAAALAATVMMTGSFGLAGQAGAVLYGDFPAPDGSLTWTGVEDDSGRLGTPAATSTGLYFAEVGIASSCSSASCTAEQSFTNEGLALEIQAGSGFGLDLLVITLEGVISASASGADMAIANVSSSVFIDIFDVDGVAINQINVSAPMLFRLTGDPAATPTEGFVFDASGAAADSGGDLAWTGEIAIDLADVLTANAVTGSVSRIGVGLSTSLSSFATGSGSAAGSVATLLISPNVVPEPGLALLMAFGLAALALRKSDRGS